MQMRVLLIVAATLSWWANPTNIAGEEAFRILTIEDAVNEAVQKSVISKAAKVNFESPLTWLVWITSLASLGLTFVVSNLLIKDNRAGEALPLAEEALTIALKSTGEESIDAEKP